MTVCFTFFSNILSSPKKERLNRLNKATKKGKEIRCKCTHTTIL
jgi:hypothetical protein